MGNKQSQKQTMITKLKNKKKTIVAGRVTNIKDIDDTKYLVRINTDGYIYTLPKIGNPKQWQDVYPHLLNSIDQNTFFAFTTVIDYSLTSATKYIVKIQKNQDTWDFLEDESITKDLNYVENHKYIEPCQTSQSYTYTPSIPSHIISDSYNSPGRVTQQPYTEHYPVQQSYVSQEQSTQYIQPVYNASQYTQSSHSVSQQYIQPVYNASQYVQTQESSIPYVQTQESVPYAQTQESSMPYVQSYTGQSQYIQPYVGQSPYTSNIQPYPTVNNNVQNEISVPQYVEQPDTSMPPSDLMSFK